VEVPVSSFWHEFRYALRLLRLSPGFTLVAILTLALGIGANTAIFQLIDSIRLRTIPVKNLKSSARCGLPTAMGFGGQFFEPILQLTFAMWEQIRKRQEGFSEIAVWSDHARMGSTPITWKKYDDANAFAYRNSPRRQRSLVAPDGDLENPPAACGSAPTLRNVSWEYWARNWPEPQWRSAMPHRAELLRVLHGNCPQDGSSQ